VVVTECEGVKLGVLNLFINGDNSAGNAGQAQMKQMYSIESEDGVTAIRFFRKANADDVLCAFNELINVNPSRLRLWHLEEGLDLSPSQIQEFANYAKSKSTEEIRVAIVTTEDLSYGLTRMYQAYRQEEHFDQQNFRSESEAICWLKGQSSEESDA
jgi:hypothetical protein